MRRATICEATPAATAGRTSQRHPRECTNTAPAIAATPRTVIGCRRINGTMARRAASLAMLAEGYSGWWRHQSFSSSVKIAAMECVSSLCGLSCASSRPLSSQTDIRWRDCVRRSRADNSPLAVTRLAADLSGGSVVMTAYDSVALLSTVGRRVFGEQLRPGRRDLHQRMDHGHVNSFSRARRRGCRS
jgi:hypothetical protein